VLCDGVVMLGKLVDDDGVAAGEHATTAPPIDAMRANAMRMRLNMVLGFLRCQWVGGFGATRGGTTTATEIRQRHPTGARRPNRHSLQAPDSLPGGVGPVLPRVAEVKGR
jgi:hypothetical protein